MWTAIVRISILGDRTFTATSSSMEGMSQSAVGAGDMLGEGVGHESSKAPAPPPESTVPPPGKVTCQRISEAHVPPPATTLRPEVAAGRQARMIRPIRDSGAVGP